VLILIFIILKEIPVKKLALTAVGVTTALGLFCSACIKDEKKPIIIKVGKEEITDKTLKDKLSDLSPDTQKMIDTTPNRKKSLLDSIVLERVLIQEAKKAGIEKDIRYIKALEVATERLLTQFYLEKLGEEKLKASDSDLQNYYNEHISAFENKVAYTFRHIAFSDKQLAQKVYNRLRKGENFDQVAKEVSKYATVRYTGLHGSIPTDIGRLPSEFETVLSKLKNNGLSEIIEVQNGDYRYHIILKISEKVVVITFAEAKETIRRIVERERFIAWYDKEKEDLNVKVNYDVPIFEQK
jgi:peptidyl-prolyl cis-trans isomerase C